MEFQLSASIAGGLALIGAWIAGADSTFIGHSQGRLYNDTEAFLLISIAFGIGTLIRQNEERNREN
ncbi:hypothetical protein IID27_03515 [Patescibacteria group bacterium]|nr:hypothetical protein [Patescibacteria group bacterium]